MNQTKDNVPLASAYCLTGTGFKFSAVELRKSLELDGDGRPTQLTAVPLYFLASHAAELFLKAALLKRGFDEADLKRYDYRHNLGSLLSELQKKGVSVTKESVETINGMSEQHNNHKLRYTVLVEDGTKTNWPPLPSVFSMLDELLLLTRISTQGV